MKPVYKQSSREIYKERGFQRLVGFMYRFLYITTHISEKHHARETENMVFIDR